jgi:hypothetical protein
MQLDYLEPVKPSFFKIPSTAYKNLGEKAFARIGDINRLIDEIELQETPEYVQQATNITTNVVLDAYCGKITTQALSAVAQASNSFSFLNSVITADSVILLTLHYSGSGFPLVTMSGQANGVVTIKITNVVATGGAALNSACSIHFKVIN